ncbi:Programmed cell death protein 2 [Glycine soja]
MDTDATGDPVDKLKAIQNDDVEYQDEDDDFDDEEEEEDDPITLGFVDKPKNEWSLRRQYFPSKTGGVPAWLDPLNIPSGRSSVCDICGDPLQLLLQVYAPTDKETTFHRMLFVFMCPSMKCLLRDQHEQWKRHPEKPSRSVKVFRYSEFPYVSLWRYYRNTNAKPIWPVSSGRPSNADIPKCSYCSGPMSCEFQILPQLLYYFGVDNEVDSLDWASIVVYACEASCEASLPYKNEFAWDLGFPSDILRYLHKHLYFGLTEINF